MVLMKMRCSWKIWCTWETIPKRRVGIGMDVELVNMNDSKREDNIDSMFGDTKFVSWII